MPREAQQKLKDRFAKWIWEDEARTERLARLYNDTFNTIRLRSYDGSHLTFPGMNRTGLRHHDLDAHQKNAVWRTIQNKNTLLGHCVGAGKTFEITAARMELKRLGLRSKPMIVVPNHLVEQWGAAFLSLYPQANIFVAGKDFFAAGKREKAMARIATGNYDAAIISHRSFESLPVSDATFHRFVKKEIASLEEAMSEALAEKGDNRSIIKQLEKAKKRLDAKIKDRASREKKDDGVTFEQLGIDQIFVDDAWAANFGEPVTALELAPDGSGYRMHTRFAKFVNLPELLSQFRTFADIQTADMLKLPRPEIEGGKPQVMVAPASPQLKAYVDSLVARAQRVRSGGLDPRVDNMLKITSDGRKAALDMRLVDADAVVEGDTKLTLATDNMFRIWKETAPGRKTQLAFCDISTPDPDKFNVYDEIRTKLMERGVPANEIAFIHTADTDAKKKALYDDVKYGLSRIADE